MFTNESKKYYFLRMATMNAAKLLYIKYLAENNGKISKPEFFILYCQKNDIKLPYKDCRQIIETHDLQQAQIYLYNKVELQDGSQGIVRYMGSIIDKQGVFYGIDITKGNGKNYGTKNNTKYFDTKKGRKTGRFCKATEILKCKKTSKSKYTFKLGDVVLCTKTKCKGIVRYVGI
eukprot:296157_1